MKKINAHQILIFYFIYSFAIKFLMLPQYLSKVAGRDAWIAAGISVLIELAILFVVLCFMTSREDEDIYGTLRRKTTFIGAKIFMAAIFAFFLVQVMITLNQTESLLSETLYDNLNVHLFIIPMLLLGIFFCYTKTRAIFRSGEIFYVLILIAIFLAILPALWKVELREVTPVLRGGLKPVLDSIYKNLVYFEAPIILLMFKGEVQIKKGFIRNFMISAGIGAIVFTAFIFFYYAVFGPLAALRPLGIVDITGLNSYIAQNGRLEWIITCVWLLLLLIRFGVLFYACFASARFLTHIKFQPAAIVFPLAIGVYLLFLFVPEMAILSALQPFIFVFYVLVLVALIIAGGRKNVQNSLA